MSPRGGSFVTVSEMVLRCGVQATGPFELASAPKITLLTGRYHRVHGAKSDIEYVCDVVSDLPYQRTPNSLHFS